NLLARMPKLEARQNLRKAYQKLVDGKLDETAFRTERDRILESTRLSEKDANSFALTVLKAAKVVRLAHVKEFNPGILVDYAVRGLYKSLNEKMPSDIKDKL